MDATASLDNASCGQPTHNAAEKREEAAAREREANKICAARARQKKKDDNALQGQTIASQAAQIAALKEEAATQAAQIEALKEEAAILKAPEAALQAHASLLQAQNAEAQKELENNANNKRSRQQHDAVELPSSFQQLQESMLQGQETMMKEMLKDLVEASLQAEAQKSADVQMASLQAGLASSLQQLQESVKGQETTMKKMVQDLMLDLLKLAKSELQLAKSQKTSATMGGVWNKRAIHQYQHALKIPGTLSSFLLSPEAECQYELMHANVAMLAKRICDQGFVVIHNCPLKGGDAWLDKHGYDLQSKGTGIAQEEDGGSFDGSRKQFPGAPPEKPPQPKKPSKGATAAATAAWKVATATWKEDYEVYLQEFAQFESHTVLLQTMLEDLGAPPVIDLIGAALTLTATGTETVYTAPIKKFILSTIGCNLQAAHYDYDYTIKPGARAPYSALFGLHGSATHAVFWFPLEGNTNKGKFFRVVFPLAEGDVVLYDGAQIHAGGEYNSINGRLFAYFGTEECPPADQLLFKAKPSDSMLDGVPVVEFNDK